MAALTYAPQPSEEGSGWADLLEEGPAPLPPVLQSFGKYFKRKSKVLPFP